MSVEEDVRALERLRAAWRARGQARLAVEAWIHEQTQKGRLARNGDAPGWQDYVRADNDLMVALAEVLA